MLYIDASSLLKTFWIEPESAAVIDALAQETSLVVSVIVQLETLVQLKAAYLAGEYTRSRWHRLEAQLAALRNQPPYDFRNVSGGVFQTAMRQHRNSRDVHCRSLDRLHLAAMEELHLNRLMTHDEAQANAAQEAGFTVIQPGRD